MAKAQKDDRGSRGGSKKDKDRDRDRSRSRKRRKRSSSRSRSRSPKKPKEPPPEEWDDPEHPLTPDMTVPQRTIMLAKRLAKKGRNGRPRSVMPKREVKG